MRIFNGIKHCYTLGSISNGISGPSSLKDLSHIENAAIVEKDGLIEWVGEESQLPSFFREAEVKNLGCETLLPGFVEAHTHLVFAGDRSHEFEMRNRGASYLEISKSGGGILSTVEQTGLASKNELMVLSQARVDEFVCQGVTALEIKSGYGLGHDAEIKMLEVAKELGGPKIIKTFLGPHSIPKGVSKAGYLTEIIERTLPEVAEKKLADRADIFVEDGFFTKEEARKYLEKAKSLGLDITAHVEQLSNQQGAELLSELEASSGDHLVEISDEGIRAFSTGSSPVAMLLPAADFYLKMDYPPARRLIDSGAFVAIATDFNPGSSPTQSLNFVGVLARLHMQMSLPEVVSAYTINAAKALKLEKERGSLSVGKVCDFVGFDCPLTQLFYQIGTHPVLFTYREGQEIWKNKNLNKNKTVK